MDTTKHQNGIAHPSHHERLTRDAVADDALTERAQMYLVMTALLRKDGHPVPLPLLAEKLAITPISANEMCHKLMERGLVMYQPHRGVTLTAQGEVVAQQVLRRRHLWETFLVERLGIDAAQADAIACELEHIASEHLIASLATFLEHPLCARTPAPCLCAEEVPSPRATHLLSTLTVGQSGQVLALTAQGVIRDFLQTQGIRPGATMQVLAIGSDGTLLLALHDDHLVLTRAIADQVVVAVEGGVTTP